MPNLTDLKLYDDNGLSTADPENWALSGVTGADKVASRVLYALLTPQGSVPGRPSDGSPFSEMLVGFNTDLDIHVAFLTALPAVIATLRAAESDDETDSERYGGCQLDGVDIAADGLTLYLNVIAKDGSRPTDPVIFTVPT